MRIRIMSVVLLLNFMLFPGSASPSEGNRYNFATQSSVSDALSSAASDTEHTLDDVIVCKTRTGMKYHVNGCRYLYKSKIEITLEEAIKEGLEPCSVCNPPEYENAPFIHQQCILACKINEIVEQGGSHRWMIKKWIK